MKDAAENAHSASFTEFVRNKLGITDTMLLIERLKN
jgi:hypothetical protein